MTESALQSRQHCREQIRILDAWRLVKRLICGRVFRRVSYPQGSRGGDSSSVRLFTARINSVLSFTGRAGVVAVLILVAACGKEDSPRDQRGTDGFVGSGEYFVPAREASAARSKLVYVPVYSEILLSRDSRWQLAATLSIRNTDPDQSIVVHNVDYYDTAGKLIASYVDEPRRLKAMATTTLLVPQSDTRGGTGANFLVRWNAEEGVNEPILEVVMAGVTGTQSFSFVRAGKTLTD